MCGLAGFVDFTSASDKAILMAMTDSLHHRGPDDVGLELFNTSDAAIGLGFRRLSIIDLSPTGHQPMINPDTGDRVMLNGEIYNYQEIRKELETLNYKFKSTSDTEVVLRSYQQWGTKCVDRFIGMFAIVLFDQRQQKLVCFRDRAGVKPFYYYWNNGLLLFASELKSFHKHPGFIKELDWNTVPLFFQHGYIPSPYCIFKYSKKLEPGHILIVDIKQRTQEIVKYWDVQDAYRLPKLNISFNDAIDETDRILKSAFNYRMVADVPVGVFLSGGYDSSCVAAILQTQNTSKINTYTIGFDEAEYNEAENAKEVASYLGTNHHEYYCTIKEALDFVPRLPMVYDEPFGDQSAIPTMLVSMIARKHVTVALSADGGDELFAGYPRHRNSLNLLKKLNLVPSFVGSLINGLRALNGEVKLSYPDRVDKLVDSLKSKTNAKRFGIINQSFSSNEIHSLFNFPFDTYSTRFDSTKSDLSGDILNEILSLEYITYLPEDILQKVDRATMAFGLEGREPFLDHRIVELVARFPSHFKMNHGNQKILLKELVHRYIPKNMLDRPKMGFRIPLESWCKGELRDLFNDVISEAKNSSNPLFKTESVSRLSESYLSGKYEDFQRIWLVFVFQMWYDQWIKN